MSWPTGYCNKCKTPSDYKCSCGYEKPYGFEYILLCSTCHEKRNIKQKRRGEKMKSIIGWSIFGTIVLVIVVLIGSVIGLSNREVELRTLIEAKQKDNTSEFDNMFKKISQVAQVSQKQMDSLKEIFNSYADARSNDGQGKMMSWIQESIPNVDTTTFNNLQNIITGSRDAWTMRQKELIDLSREHTVMLRRFPAGFVLTTFMGRKPIEIVIITSSRTEEAFNTGKDDSINVF